MRKYFKIEVKYIRKPFRVADLGNILPIMKKKYLM